MEFFSLTRIIQYYAKFVTLKFPRTIPSASSRLGVSESARVRVALPSEASAESERESKGRAFGAILIQWYNPACRHVTRLVSFVWSEKSNGRSLRPGKESDLLSNVLQAVQARDPIAVTASLLAIVVVLLSVTIHESMHAYTADYLGDRTPRYQGRLTFNPLAHLDPIWTLMIVIAGFGMGKPVQFNPLALRTDRRTGSALVALAGPMTNVVLGFIFGLVLRLLLTFVPFTETSLPLFRLTAQTLGLVVILNFGLAIFNMIPFPPLDGSKVLLALLPPDMAYSLENAYAQIGQYGLILVFVILILGRDVIGAVIFGPAQALFNLIVGTG